MLPFDDFSYDLDKMGLLGGAKEGLKTKTRSKSDASSLNGTEGGESGYDTTNLDKEQGNVLMSIISQCEVYSFSYDKSAMLDIS